MTEPTAGGVAELLVSKTFGMEPDTRCRRAGRAVRWGLFAAALVLAETAGPGDSYGYRFLWEGPSGAADEFYRVGSRFREPPRIWHPDVWGPGKVLSFVLVDSPDWGAPSEDVRRQLEEAMAVWSQIETADIRWEIGRVATPDEDLGEASRITPIYPGGHPGVHVRFVGVVADPNADWSPILERTCHVVLHPENVRIRDVRTIAHEFGHCVGLDHPDMLRPGGKRLRPEIAESVSFAPLAPIMRARNPQDVATLDDRIGASLLWPRTGWLARTGTLWGNVLTADGGPVSWVSVVAGRVRRDGTIGDAVARFTDDRGEFVIQGLDPGDYVLQSAAEEEEEEEEEEEGGGTVVGQDPPCNVAGGPRVTARAVSYHEIALSWTIPRVPGCDDEVGVTVVGGNLNLSTTDTSVTDSSLMSEVPLSPQIRAWCRETGRYELPRASRVVERDDEAIAGARQSTGAVDDLLQDGIRVEARVDAQHGCAEPRETLTERLVLLC